ncbi:hypothetical protein ACX801_20965 [Arthrobacter bambusae]
MALISPNAVQQRYGIPAAQLRRWRQHRIGPDYFQFTPRTTSYSEEYLNDWLNDPANAHLTATIRHTGQHGGADTVGAPK